MPRPRKLTDEEIAAAQVMRLAGVPIKTIGARFGVGRTRLWMLLRELEKDVHEHQNDSNHNSAALNIAGQST